MDSIPTYTFSKIQKKMHVTYSCNQRLWLCHYPLKWPTSVRHTVGVMTIMRFLKLAVGYKLSLSNSIANNSTSIYIYIATVFNVNRLICTWRLLLVRLVTKLVFVIVRFVYLCISNRYQVQFELNDLHFKHTLHSGNANIIGCNFVQKANIFA